ncbi:MAG: VWA domain-containing protein [Candidatus Melainabacteria bacterium]|nr:VWA domain-containing protein [Candidatus Melainabacteria bacterium]MBI3308169.1 VWA domain-containing protein [Candidatus Melainabacteria bacterium]
MSFVWPQALFFYILVPCYIFLHLYFEKKKNKDIIPFGNMETLLEAITKTKNIDLLKHLPLILNTLILCLFIFAIARPISTIYVPIRDTKIMLLIDNSISMEATDIEPNRITAAKETARKFIQDLPKGIQVGIGFFSGNIKILVNPTVEKDRVLNALNKLNIKTLEASTAIGDAILAGSDSITLNDSGNKSIKYNRQLLLITDGESNIGSDPLFAAAQAKVNNIIIQAIGIGNPLGTIIRGGILTRLDEFTLKEITLLTGGEYFNAKNLDEMNKIYKKIRKTIRLIPKEKEITFIPVLFIFGFIVLLQLLKWSKFRFA